MALNPLIPLSAQAADTGPATNRLLSVLDAMPTKMEREQAIDDRELGRFKSVYTGALQLKPFLEQGDVNSARTTLTRRLNSLKDSGVNTDQTMEALSMLDQDPTGKALLGQVNNVIQAGNQMFGPQAGGAPAAIQDRNDLLNRLPIDESGNLKPVEQMTAAEKAAAIEARLIPGAVGTGAITAATTEGLTDKVAGSEGKISGAKKAAESSIKKSDEAMDKLGAVRKSIINIDEAIAAIDSGAQSGVIQSRLPSIRSASVELDNIRGRMGLDIIGGTTFGALSEAELKFALDTAMPQNLEPADLRDWLTRKKSAQEKLAQELESAAIYLGKPGNTPAGYLEFRRNQTQQESSQSNGNIGRFQVEVLP